MKPLNKTSVGLPKALSRRKKIKITAIAKLSALHTNAIAQIVAISENQR